MEGWSVVLIEVGRLVWCMCPHMHPGTCPTRMSAQVSYVSHLCPVALGFGVKLFEVIGPRECS